MTEFRNSGFCYFISLLILMKLLCRKGEALYLLMKLAQATILGVVVDSRGSLIWGKHRITEIYLNNGVSFQPGTDRKKDG